MKSHRHKLLDGEVVTEGGVPSVAPGLGVNGHAVFPFVFEQVSWLVAVGAGVIPTVCADGAFPPSIVRHHCIPDWTVIR